MQNAHYRWVIVAAGGLIGCVAMGAMFALPVFLRPMSESTGWSVTGISSAMTIGFLAMAFGSMIWGNLSDRWGARPVVFAGGALLSAGLALAALSPSLLIFQLLFGVMVGGASAAIMTPLMASVTGWFETQRGLAVSLVSAGMGMAPLTMAPFAAWLITVHDWRASLLIIAAVAAAIILPATLLLRTAPSIAAPDQHEAAHADPTGGMSLSEVLRSPPFLILTFTSFFCCATHSGPIFHTVSYAVTCGIPMIAAVSIYSIEGLAGMGGRIAFGLLGDRFGAKRVLSLGLLAQAFGALAYIFVANLIGFYSVAAVFGFIYAGVMPLYAVLVRENFPLRMMGTVIGGVSMAGSLGMAAGPMVGGMIYDSLSSYQWLYIGSWGMGIGAFLIASTFRPIKHQRPDALAAA